MKPPTPKRGRPAHPIPSARTNLILDAPTMARVKHLATQEDRPVAAMLRRLVVAGLAILEEARKPAA